MTMKHQLVNPSATNTQGKCSAHASAQVWMRNCTALNCVNSALAAPTDGYEYYDSCDGQQGFASTTGGFVTKTFDLSDAVAAGGNNLSFTLQNNLTATSPNPATPNAAVNWYIDDVQVFSLTVPVVGGISMPTEVLAGPLAAINWAQPSFGGVVYGPCINGIPGSLTATMRAEDTRGNLARGVDEVLHFAWTAPGVYTSTLGTTVGSAGSQNADVQFTNSVAGVAIATAGVASTVTVTASDARTQGLTVPAPASMAFQTLICHYNGNSGLPANWSDTTPLNTFNQTQATRACEAAHGLNACTFGNNRVIGPLFANCAAGYQWIVAPNTQANSCSGGVPSALVAGQVLVVDYIVGCFCSPNGTTLSPLLVSSPTAQIAFAVLGTWN